MSETLRQPGEYLGLGPLASVEQISAWLESLGLTVASLGNNFAGQPLLVTRRGGASGRPIVITAGAHAGEPSGVLAALLLARDYDFAAPTIIVPLRDPFAWQGYEPALEFACGGDQIDDPITDYRSSVEALLSRGEKLHDEGGLVIAEIGGMVFATMPTEDPPIGPRQLEQAVNVALTANPELVKRTLGKRIVFPSNAGSAEGVGDFLRAFSATIRGKGIVADMNRGFGGPEEPAEVRLLRELVDDVKPGLVLDLHEGQGTSYYVFVGADSPHASTREFAREALKAMGSDGHGPVTLADLERSFGPRIREGLTEPEPGMMVGRVQSAALEGTSFGNYCDRHCPSITLETGRWAPLADRVRWQLAGATAVLNRYQATAS
mgnify:CR=1 FL=1